MNKDGLFVATNGPLRFGRALWNWAFALKEGSP